MNSVPQGKFSEFKDEVGEIFHETARAVKKQVTQKPDDSAREAKKDLVTGKPIPTKKMLGNLSEQVAQLSRMRLKKVREELEKQRLKVKQMDQVKQVEQVEQAKPKDDIVQQTLKGSKSTGEFKGLIGG